MQKPYDTQETTTVLNTTSFFEKGQLVSSSNSLVPYGYYRDVKTPSVTPNYKVRVKRGPRLKPLSYTRFSTVSVGERDGLFVPGREVKTQERITGWNGSNPITTIDTVTSQSRRAYWYGSTVHFSPSFEIDVNRAESLAINKLLLKMKDQKFNAVQAYAEADQTYRMITKAAKKLATTLVFLRKGNLHAAGVALGLRVSKREIARYNTLYKKIKDEASIANMLSSGILTVQYGIRPLLSDVVGAAEMFAQKHTAEIINRVHAKGEVFRNEKLQTRHSGTYNAYGKWVAQCDSHLKSLTKVTYGCEFTSGDDVQHTVSQLGITNPLLIAWELMPWSFVIDWFIPIGNAISALDATRGLTFGSGYRTTRISLEHVKNQEVTGHVKSTGGSSVTYSFFQRLPLSSFPSARLPHFKNPVSLEHALNAIALLVQVRNKVVKKHFRD